MGTMIRTLAPYFILVISIISFASPFVHAKTLDERQWRVKSPNGEVEIHIRGTQSQGLEYQVVMVRDKKHTVAVDWSRLGITTRYFDYQAPRMQPIDTDFSNSLKYFKGKTLKGRQTYSMVTGKRKENTTAYNQRSLSFRNSHTKQVMRLDVRALDNGVAFRYALPNTGGVHHQLRREITEFNIGEGGQHWGQPYEFITPYHPAYETEYVNVPSGTAVPEGLGTGWGFPSLFHNNGVWVFIHESGLGKQFHGSHLQANAYDGVYKIAPPLEGEAAGNGTIYPTGVGEWKMPWRFLVVSDNLADIVESNRVFDLAEPTKVANVDWIKPGPASWSWWADHESSKDLRVLKEYIKLADKIGWPYSVIDSDWPAAGEQVMEELIEYANEKEVGLFFWYNSGGPNNFIPEKPRDILYDRLSRRKEFERISALGVKGVKIDFFQSDKQFVIQQYLNILEDAADFKLLVIFHGCTIPRGWERTWPNLMTMEAVRGGEFYTFSEDLPYGLYAPRQNTILPFTRNVVGSMDYTPVAYTPQQSKRYTTFAHETALPVIFESGVHHMADEPDAFLGLPEAYRDYYWSLPTAWDETVFLGGYPGKDIIMARRNGSTWYVAGINGENLDKEWIIDLSRLEGRATTGRLYADSLEKEHAHEKVTIPVGKKVAVKIQPFGGFVLVFK